MHEEVVSNLLVKAFTYYYSNTRFSSACGLPIESEGNLLDLSHFI